MTLTLERPPPVTMTTRRLEGVDVARGIALFGMMAVHVFGSFWTNGQPTPATIVAGGRAAATFAFIAGVSLAFLSGGRKILIGRRRAGAAAGIAVRGVLIGLLGLSLGYINDTALVILPFYGIMFLLIIPLLGARPRALGTAAVAIMAMGPVVMLLFARAGLSFEARDESPTLGTLIHDPLGLVLLLFVTGAYPVLAYLAYVCAGMAIGRLDLTSRSLAWWLLVGGVALAVAARIVSKILLFPMGGLSHLTKGMAEPEEAASPSIELLWDPDQRKSWWYLALSSPHSYTSLDVAHTLGSAMAVLGACLLLMRVAATARLLKPVADAGSMTLTLYTAHLVVLPLNGLDDAPHQLTLVYIVGSVLFAVLWRRFFGQGPLERLLAAVANYARSAVGGRRPTPPSTVDIERVASDPPARPADSTD